MVGSSVSGSIALQSNRNVIDIGGFMGSDPAPSLAKLRHFIATGQLHYILLDDGSLGGFPGGGPDGRDDATSAREAWIRSHGTVVHVAGQSLTGGGMTLYYFAATG